MKNANTHIYVAQNARDEIRTQNFGVSFLFLHRHASIKTIKNVHDIIL